MKKYVLLVSVSALLVLLIAIGALIYIGTNKQASTTGPVTSVASGNLNEVVAGAKVITLTKNGFEPSEITIKAGDTITFKSTTGSLYWPASNLHPSHLVYPEFDPLVPVQPNDSWSFVFTKVGAWKFHDHLSPYFTGVITVTE